MPTLATASLDPRERRALERLVEMLKSELGQDLHAVWLFGSRARGEQPGEESDIDLLILTRGGWGDDSMRVVELLFQAADAEGVSPVYFSTHVRDRAWVEGRRAIESFFIQEVDRDKIVLFGEP